MFFLIAGCSSVEEKVLFYPTHKVEENGLTPWFSAEHLIGYSRRVETPKNVWLMLHGNGGQASDRAYSVACFSTEDSVFILEYPGYGARKGTPSAKTFNRAAKEAYLFLRESYPDLPVCVVGESIGTGPAASLASLEKPPEKIVLIVPFDELSKVAERHFSSFLVGLFLRSGWDNIEALSGYKGKVDIFGAEVDTVIPLAHAKALAEALPESKLWIIEGGHNDWSYQNRVRIRNP